MTTPDPDTHEYDDIAPSRASIFKPQDWPIFYKVVIFAVALVVLVLGVITYVNSRILQTELQEKTGEEFTILASSQLNSLANLLDQQLTILRTLTLSEPIRYSVEVANLDYLDDEASGEAQMMAVEESWLTDPDDSPLVQGIISPHSNQITAQLLDYRANFSDHLQLFVTDGYGGLLAATDRFPA
jgi:hypothetical protein